ncbi:MAG: DUF6350 family protein [Pseudonocardiales bacterium]
MTDVLTSVEPLDAEPEGRQSSVVVAGVTAAGWAVGVGLIAVTVVVLVAWSGDGRSGSSAAAALRIAADVWLLANGTPLKVGGTMFDLVPLGLAALPACLLIRSGASLARTVGVTDLRGAARATGVLALAYAVLAVVVTGPATTAQVHPAPLLALVAAAVLAGVFGGVGVLRGADLWPATWTLLPEPVRLTLHGGAVAVAVLFAGAALLGGAALALSGSEAGSVLSALRTGVVGTLVLLAVSLAYLPNAVVWAAAYLAGPGFAVGTGTTVGAFDVRLRPVPALPLLAALPSAPLGWLAALLLLPATGGLLAGAAVGRRQAGTALRRMLGTAAATGPAAGIMVGVLCLVSGGPSGGRQLAAVGPSAWRVALVLAAEVALPAMAAAWWTARHRSAKAAGRDQQP